MRWRDAGGVPEVAPADLSPAVLRAAILRGGCLLVRELVPRADAERFAHQIERAFTERERHDAGRRFDDGLYSEFEPEPRYEEPIARQWIKSGGGLLAVDSPTLSLALLELFRAAGLPSLAEAYLGEPALVAADKTTLRKADPAVSGGWHQDGKFMGDVNALNVWLSLSRCGDDAPGLDIVPRRFEHHVTTQTDEAILDNMVSQRMAEEAAGDTPDPAADLRTRRRAPVRRAVPAQDGLGSGDAQPAVRGRELVLRRLRRSRRTTSPSRSRG